MDEFSLFVLQLCFLLLGIAYLQSLPEKVVSGRALVVRTLIVSAAAFLFTFWLSDPDGFFCDYRDTYHLAGAAVLKGREELAALMKHGVFGFVNLPVIAYAFAPLAVFEEKVAACLFTVVGLLAVLGCWRLLVICAGLGRREAAILFFLFSINGPLAYGLREANTSHFALLGVLAAYRLMGLGHFVVAGGVLALAGLLKLPLLLFGLHLFVKARWRAAAGWVAVLVGATLLSLLLFGPEAHRAWYRECVAPAAQGVIPAFNVQSPAAMFARMEQGPRTLLDWSPHEITGWRAIAGQIVTAAVMIPLLLFLVAGRERGPHARPTEPFKDTLDFMLVLVASLIGGPMSWSHYYLWLLMPIAFFIGRGPGLTGKWTRIAGWLAIALITPPISVIRFSSEPVRDLYSRVAVSHLLLGGTLLFLVLVRARIAVGPATVRGWIRTIAGGAGSEGGPESSEMPGRAAGVTPMT